MKQTKTILIIFSLYQSILAQNFIYNPGFDPIQSDFDKEYAKSNPSDDKYARGDKSYLQSWRVNFCHSLLPLWNRDFWTIAELYDNPFNNKYWQGRKVFGKSYAMITATGYDLECKRRPTNPKSDYLETKLKRLLTKGKIQCKFSSGA